jgi:hypothetical protein
MSEVGNGAFDLDLAVSSLAADQNDTQLMMRLLVARLAPVLGDRLRVERAGGRLRKSETLRRVEVQIGDSQLSADLDRSSPVFSIGHVSGGVRIRTMSVDAAGWLRHLLELLQSEAAHSETARLALESIVIGGS